MSFGDDTLDPSNHQHRCLVEGCQHGRFVERYEKVLFSESWGKISAAGLHATREIMKERVRQNELKAQGQFKFTCADVELAQAEKAAILMEEVGEVCRALLTLDGLSFNDGKQNLRKELVQVAAIALAWLEAL